MDKLTSWWVRASKTTNAQRRIVFFDDFPILITIQPMISLHITPSIFPFNSGLSKLWEGVGSHLKLEALFFKAMHIYQLQMVPILEVLGVNLCEIIWNSKQKVYHMWKQWSYSDPVFTYEFLGEKGNKLNNEIHASYCDVQCDHSNYDVKPWGTGQLEEHVSITYASNTTKRWQSQASDTVNNACFGFDDQTNCPKNTTQIWYIYTYYIVKSCGRLFWSHSNNCTISNWKAGSCRPSRFLHCIRVLRFALNVFIIVKSQFLHGNKKL